MLFQNITVLDEALKPADNCFVGIKGQQIDYIGTEMPKRSYDRIYDGRGKILMSGMVNAHAHTPMMYMRGFGGNRNLQDWLTQKIFPFEAKMTGSDVYYSMLMGIAESLRFGITSTTDMYYYGEEMAQAVLETGVKGNIGVSLICKDQSDYWDLPIYREATKLFQQYHNQGDGRLRVELCIHGEYTSTPKTVRQLSEHAKELGAGVLLHLSESKQEVEECRQRHGMTPPAYFEQLGTLDNPTTAAHCVWLEEEDFDILARKGVTVASCPVSNLKLGNGVANVPKMQERGISVALGTDSVSSNNNLNLLEDVKYFSLVHKGWFGDPTATTPAEALRAATAAGAKAQGRTDTGALKEGKRADLIVLDASAVHMRPMHDAVENIVYAGLGSDVVLTMVDGRVLYENGCYTTIDIEKTIYEVEKNTSRILGEL